MTPAITRSCRARWNGWSARLGPGAVVDVEFGELLDDDPAIPVTTDGRPNHITRVGENPFPEGAPPRATFPHLQCADEHTTTVVGEAVREGVPPTAGDRDRTRGVWVGSRAGGIVATGDDEAGAVADGACPR